MSDEFAWICEDASGRIMTGQELPDARFPSQAEAEGWLSESWMELLAAGVEQVTLRRDGALVYGPMSLRDG
ncbi:MAG: hypothetical protein ACK5MP_11155 [Nostocoides sp.]